MTRDVGSMSKPLIEVIDLKKYFPVRGGAFSRVIDWLRAVDNVSLKIAEGETLGLVGESGCGKSTLGRTILRLEEPTEGIVLFEKTNIFEMNKKELQRLRRNAQIIFQDPLASLNPRMLIRDIIGEAITTHGLAKGREVEERVKDLLKKVGLDPRSHADRYAHEFSGGQTQRIGIARALALNPKFLILDEPTSALDVSVQAQILNLLQDLQEELNLTYLFTTHNLSTVKHVSDRTAVMYLGKIVEIAPTKEIFKKPFHPYTQGLISAIPVPDPRTRIKETILLGDVPSPINIPPGCRFHTRCPYARRECEEKEPELTEVAEEHYVACFFWNSI